jgi:hypothetical protein
MSAPRIGTGQLYAVEVICPMCGRLELIAVNLGAVLTTPGEGVPALKVKATSKALDHWCTPAGADTPRTLFSVTDDE